MHEGRVASFVTKGIIHFSKEIDVQQEQTACIPVLGKVIRRTIEQRPPVQASRERIGVCHALQNPRLGL